MYEPISGCKIESDNEVVELLSEYESEFEYSSDEEDEQNLEETLTITIFMMKINSNGKNEMIHFPDTRESEIEE